MMIALIGFNANAALYIVGQAPFGDWHPDAGVEMTYDNGIYTYKATLSGTVWFVFATQLDADWDILNPNYRIGPTDGNKYLLEGVEYSTQMAGGDNGAYSFNGYGVEYTITFDEENMKFKIEADVPRGDVNYDTTVSIADVTDLIDILLSGQTASATADCNRDGNVTIADVTSLIDFLLSGNWPVPEMVYTVAGEESVFGSNWDPTDVNNDMVKGANGIYTWSKTGVALTDNFEFKVVGDHNWSVYEWPEGMGNNFVAEVTEEGIYDIVITFNPEAAEEDRISYTLTKTGNIEPVYTVIGTANLFEADWDPNYEKNEMVKGSDGSYHLYTGGYFTEGTEIYFKVVRNHNLDISWPEENRLISIAETGGWDIEIIFDPNAYGDQMFTLEINKLF